MKALYTLAVFALLALISFATPKAHAQSDAPQKVLKNRMLFNGGKVLVILPKREDGSNVLRAFTTQDFDNHYGNGQRPEYAFIDDSTDSRISVSVTNTKLAPNELEAYKTKMEKSLAKAVKDIIWHKREIVTLGDKEWVHLEMQNKSTDGATVMSDFYVTSMAGHPLMFTIQTNTKHWYEMRKVMQKMMISVDVQEKTDSASVAVPGANVQPASK